MTREHGPPCFCAMLANITVLLIATSTAIAQPTGSQATSRPDYEFTLDGRPVAPWVHSLNGTPSNPRPGDVIRIGDWHLVLDSPGLYHFKSGGQENDRLMRITDDGRQFAICVKTKMVFDEDDPRSATVNDPFSKMAEADLKALRGVRLNAWPASVGMKLANLDVLRCCLVLGHQVADGKAQSLPPLPASLQYLIVEEDGTGGMEDYARLANMKELRLLRLQSMTLSQFDCALLRGHQQLRYLDLSGIGQLKNSHALANLGELRELRLAWNRELTEIEFAGSLRELRSIDISRTAVSDLSPLSDLEHLRTVDASVSAVARLPSGRMSGLVALNLLGSKANVISVSDFANDHPNCRVYHRWNQTLQDALRGVTRLRVRSGGTCCRVPAVEKTLIEEKDPKVVAQLIEKIDVDDRQSGFHCMCCGEPTFEFYRDDKLLASVGLHHGRSLRWSGGWPGDAMLTADSAEFISRWLAARGVRGPAEERERATRRAQAAARRAARYRELMPKELYEAMSPAESFEQMPRLLEAHIADPARRIELCFKLLGCDMGPWDTRDSLQQIIIAKVLPAVSAADLAAAIERAVSDPATSLGAARYLFEEEKWHLLDSGALGNVLPKLAGVGVSHPQAGNRRRTLRALSRIGSPEAIKVLVAVLSGEVKIHPLPDDQVDGPGGMVTFHPGDQDAPEDCSDQAYAALLLARLGQKARLAQIEAMAKSANRADRDVLVKAIKILSNSAGGVAE